MPEIPERIVDRKSRMKIPHTPYPERCPEERVRDFDEVAIGYDAETARREAGRCIQCPAPSACVEACPLHNDIPGAMWLISEGDFIIGKTTPCLKTRDYGLVVADEAGRTSREGVFAGGDAVTGPDLVSTAVAAGFRAAEAIHQYLTNGRS